jgi:HK97 family phage major capsid protein
MNTIRFKEGSAVRALEGHRLEVLAAPYGSPQDRDHLNEYFSARTDFMLDVGDRRPAIYFHGFTSEKKMAKKPAPIGIATAARTDNAGLWMEVTLKPSPIADRLYAAAEAGTCRASTGAINYLCRTAKDGEVEVWPIGELSLIDEGPGRHPANDKAIALPLKAMFAELELEVPEGFGEDPEQTAHTQGAVKMADEDIAVEDEPQAPDPVPAAMAAEEPKRRAIFNIKKETIGEPADNAKKETWEYVWHLRHGQYMPSQMRVLEETEAAEGGPMVPNDMLNQIVTLRDETSLASRAGLTRYVTDKLTFNIPREVTAMTALAAIAEEGAYVAQEPVFGTLALTMQKYGKLVTVTEELLEDQNLFMPWFIKACGRAWALAENAALYTAADVATNGTVGVAGSDTLTLAEWNTFYYFMTTPYRDNCVLVMNPNTMPILQGLLVATPYAFGAYPDVQRTPLGLPSFSTTPIHLCSDWLIYTGAAALGCVLSMINREYAGICERRGLSIKVDPYGDSLNGRIRYYPSARFAPFFAQPLAHVVKNGV